MSQKKTGPSEVMVVNEVPGEECRIAILDDGHLEELYAERVATATNVGNIYKGRVTNVEPAIQAAFIDYGRGANGFLHISDLHPRYFPKGDKKEQVGKKIPRRERPPIQAALKRGDEVLVQVLKEGIGTKGPTLTSYLSIPGRLMVLMPEMDKVGVSRKVEDDELRREMRKALDGLELPDGFGFILRTAGLGKSRTELKRDVAYLTRLWRVMEDRIAKIGAPCSLYQESDLLIRTVRDVLRPTIKAIVVDSEAAFDRLNTFLQVVAPRSAPPVIHYRRRTPIFHAFDVERQIDLIHARQVPLPSGGALVIDQTEALVAIDVNSGRSRTARDSETNAFQTNVEAVDEICRQLRLRDLGGLVVLDLIDMRAGKHRKAIEDRVRENLKRDRARTTIGRISEFGLLEMTRQRMRPSIRKSYFAPCPHCEGRGEVRTAETLGAEVVRQASCYLDLPKVARVEVVCSPRVASVLLSRRRRELVRIEDATGKRIDVRVSDEIPVDQIDYYAYDERGADIELATTPPPKMPRLEDLVKESEAPETDEFEEFVEGTGRKKRRRRRRRGGPADATAIALSGAFLADIGDEDEDEDDDLEIAAPRTAAGAPSADGEAGEGGRRRRRRRRRRKGAGGEGEGVGPAVAEPPPPPVVEVEPPIEGPLRVHELAKLVEHPSKEIVAWCGEHGIEVKNHMSTLTLEDARTVWRAFAPPPPPPPTPEVEDEEAEDELEVGASVASERAAGGAPDGGPKKKRRRRGGRRRRGRGGEVAEAGVEGMPDDEAPHEPSAVAADEEDEDDADHAVDTTAGADERPASHPADDGARAGAAKKKRRRRRGGRGRAGADDAAASEAEADGPAPKAAVENAPAANGVVEVEAAKPAAPRRRSLYRNRKPVSAAARGDEA